MFRVDGLGFRVLTSGFLEAIQADIRLDTSPASSDKKCYKGLEVS